MFGEGDVIEEVGELVGVWRREGERTFVEGKEGGEGGGFEGFEEGEGFGVRGGLEEGCKKGR